MVFIRLMVAMILIMWFGDGDHQHVAVFLEYLRTEKRDRAPAFTERSDRQAAIPRGKAGSAAGHGRARGRHPDLASRPRKPRPGEVSQLKPAWTLLLDS